MKRLAIPSLITNFLKGLFIGIANTIPGVSGGTIAVITNIYKPLIEFFASFVSQGSIWKKQLREIAPLLIPVVFGVLTGIVFFANVIEHLFNAVPSQTQFFFIGLIIGSLPFLMKQSRKVPFKLSYLIPFLICIVLLLWLAIRSAQVGDRSTLIDTQRIIRELTPGNALLIVISGMIATGAMVVPGVSGSFLLLLVGMYATFKTMVVELNFPVIALFLTGAVFGILFVSKIITLFLQNVYGHSYYAILGLVLGSIAFLWPGFQFDITGLTSIVSCIFGFFLSFFLSADHKNRISQSRRDLTSSEMVQ